MRGTLTHTLLTHSQKEPREPIFLYEPGTPHFMPTDGPAQGDQGVRRGGRGGGGPPGGFRGGGGGGGGRGRGGRGVRQQVLCCVYMFWLALMVWAVWM